jgi:MYXO-CTERM domain-containing protein
MKNLALIVAPFAAALALGFTLSAPARADVVDPDYEETCTISKQQKDGESCVECSASVSDSKACETAHSSDGYTERCKTRGASAWVELWCKSTAQGQGGATTSQPAKDKENKQDDGGCSVAHGERSGAAGLGALALALGMAFVGRRRRR